MKTKVTLSINESTIKKSRLYAKQTGKSLSRLVENYLETLTDENHEKRFLSSKLSKIVGAVKLPFDFDETVASQAYFENKHL